MPSLKTYRKMLGTPKTNGESRVSQSNMIIEETWWEDIGSQVAYLFDWYHDKNKEQLDDINTDGMIPIDIKYIISAAQTYEKDAVTYHIQLRPSQECNVQYYNEFFAKRYGATFPCGLYIAIKDNKGKYNRWLVVGKANYNDTMFSTYQILRCDYIFNWINNGVKYKMAGVLRSQNSYNSGIWTDYKITSVEDCYWFSLNRFNCWNTLRALILQQKDEIRLYGIV